MISKVFICVAVLSCASSFPFPESVAQYHPPPYHPQQEKAPSYSPPSYNPPIKHRDEDPYNKHQYIEEEPRPYAFDYGVRDDYTGANFGHQEDSDGNTIKGSYSVQLPDGRIQKVNYIADHYNGFQAEVTYEGEATYPEYKPQNTYGEPPKQPQYQPKPQYSAPQPSYLPNPRYKPEAPAYSTDEVVEGL